MSETGTILPDHEEASRRFGNVFLSLTRRSVDTTTFRRLTQLGIPHAQAHLTDQNHDFINDLARSAEFDTFFVDRAAALAHFGGLPGMIETVTANQLRSFQMSVDSASLVFAHSALDAAVSELCWITALSAPGDWEQFVSSRKISLADAKGSSLDELIRLKIVEYLSTFERESLLSRVDRLFALCKPKPGFEGVKGYKFNRDRLARLDDLRHQVVHHETGPSAFVDIDADLEFIFQAGLHLWGMVNRHYGVKIDVRYLFGLPTSALG
jgi:hypothetical protein